MGEIDDLKTENENLRIELEATQANMAQYLQNVAHQLTAPLGAIKWSIEAIKDRTVPIERKMKLLSSVYSQATILVHLIKNFTLMSNLEADHELGQFREKPEPVNLLTLSINLVNDFQPQAHEKGIKITVDDESFDEVFMQSEVSIEKNLVSQAISNVLENAVKYADHDSEILVYAIEADTGCGISIESIGIPISETEKERIMERGFRGATALQKVATGTGFGLYLATRVMAFHGGTIDVGTNNRRSAFSLLFPESRLARGGVE